MKLTIDSQEEEGGRKVYIDDTPEPSFFLTEEKLQELLKEARHGAWSNNPQKGKDLGQQLFHLLNRNNGQLQYAVDECVRTGSDFFLYLSLPMEFTEIPFELMYHHNFIALQPKAHIIRLVSEKMRPFEKENRPLKVLFVAASPIDLEDATLEFEKEEDLILSVVKKYPLDLSFEDTGSLDGIEQKLHEIQGTDVLHISGHAGHDYELGPVFYMEDALGKLDKVIPDRLYKAIKDSCPKMLFLSGCSTGKSDKNIGVESFAYQMVKKGVPFVLSWGLPVSDEGATIFSRVLYEKLAKGKTLAYAIQESRLAVETKYHPWPLMRLFTDNTKCAALVEEGQTSLRKTNRQIIHKKLKDSNVQVLDQGFVGRRRQLQNALTVINNQESYEDNYGLLIHGPAGVGKSCLAGRIFERQSQYEIIILRGELEQNIIIHELKIFFDKKGNQDALTILGSDRSYEEKIKELYRTIFKDNNLVIYFDDFEKNLYLEENTWYLKPAFLNNFRPFLQYIDYAENQSKITITSRYTFDLQAEGKNLSRKFLFDIPLMSFTGSDETKKLNDLVHIAKSKNIGLYKQFGHGNPRLMEWLDKIAASEKKYNFDELQEALAGKEEDYIREYLAEIITKAEGFEFAKFLHLGSVYRLPVKADAFQEFGDIRLLERGVDLTLFEKETVQGQENRFWVMPVIHQQMWQKLNKTEQEEAHKTALNWYDAYLEKWENIPYHNEALRHALEINEIDLASKHVLPLGNELNRLLCYQEQRGILEKVISHVNKKIIAQAKKNKKQSISSLFNQYANLLAALGDAKKAVEYYERALQIDLALFGDKHPRIINDYLNLASIFKSENKATEELKYLLKVFEIVKSALGTEHEFTQTINKRIEELKKNRY